MSSDIYKVYLKMEDIDLLENEANCLRDKLLVRLLFRLGCRVSEALSLEVKDINFTSSTATIQHLKSRVNLACPHCNARLGRHHSYCPKCGDKVDEAIVREQEHRRMRTLPIDHDTLAMLKEYVDRGGPILKNGKRLIFGINRHHAWRIIKDCAERAGLPRIINTETGKTHYVSPHRLRDAFAVHAVKLDDSGDGLRLLQEHLGHVSFDTTARYRKVAGDELRNWYDRLWQKEEAGGATA